MIRKTEKLLITFFTTTEAMAMERLCKAEKMPGRIIPVPSSITADCGLAWCADPQNEPVLLEFIEKQNLHYQGVYRCMV